jgi:hypothetical protein
MMLHARSRFTLKGTETEKSGLRTGWDAMALPLPLRGAEMTLSAAYSMTRKCVHLSNVFQDGSARTITILNNVAPKY